MIINPYRFAKTITTGFIRIPVAYTVPSTLTDFPVYVKPSAINGLGSLTLSEAKSTRFYSDSSGNFELPREVVSADEIHVKMDSLSAGDSLYLDYDGVRTDYADTDPFGTYAVWKSDYKMVSHDGGGTDSTSNQNTGTGKGGIIIGGAQGPVGAATEFDGNDTYIDLPHTLIDGRGDLTISFWAKYREYGVAAVSAVDSSGTNMTLIQLGNSGTTKWIWNRDDWSFGPVIDKQKSHYYATVNKSSDTRYAFIDDVQMGPHSSSGSINVPPNGFVLGQDQDSVGGGFDPPQAFRGTLDEFRVSYTTPGADWVATEYANQSDPSTFFGTAVSP